MFLQLVRDAQNPQNTPNHVRALFQYHPLQLTALVETAWRNRSVGNAFPFDAWPQAITNGIINAFPQQPQLVGGNVNWDHLIYAYLIENTGICEIFRAVVKHCQHDETLQVPSVAGQRFLRNTEFLLYSDPALSTVWNLTSHTRQDELAHRMTTYWRAFGLDLSHADELAAAHPYEKPAASNVDFIPTLDTLLREVWCGIANARNIAGVSDTDNEAVRQSARHLYDLMATRRLHGNFAREEFRAVAIMSWLHLAVLFNSPIVVDLRAEASSPELRLAKIADRVGISMHPQAQALFQLAQPASFLMQAIEQGTFNAPAGAHARYLIPWMQRLMEVVIDQYGTAMNRDAKARRVVVVQPDKPRLGAKSAPPRLIAAMGAAAADTPVLAGRTPAPPPSFAATHANGLAAR